VDMFPRHAMLLLGRKYGGDRCSSPKILNSPNVLNLMVTVSLWALASIYSGFKFWIRDFQFAAIFFVGFPKILDRLVAW